MYDELHMQGKDLDYLSELWTGAVKIANKHVPDRKVAVVSEVSARLQGAGRPSKAAQLLAQSGMNEEALKVCTDDNDDAHDDDCGDNDGGGRGADAAFEMSAAPCVRLISLAWSREAVISS